MYVLLIWLGLIVGAGSLALSRGRRPLSDAWPAYLFALPVATHLSALASGLTGPVATSMDEFAVLLQHVALAGFYGLIVVLFAIRNQVSGLRAGPIQGLVALLGTFVLGLVAFLPAESISTGAMLSSSALIICGTAFAAWSVAVLGRCFGLFPEVRGLVVRGPYLLVRHPVYAGELIAACGILLARPHVLTVTLLAAFIGLQYWRTIFEERALVAAFPGEYAAYRAVVPRLVPGVRLRGLRRLLARPTAG